MKNYYQILGVPSDASNEEIKAVYKALAMMCHPDKNQGSKKFEDKLKKITLAYSQLKMNLGKK